MIKEMDLICQNLIEIKRNVNDLFRIFNIYDYYCCCCGYLLFI